MVDAAALAALPKEVLVGADMLTYRGLVNKVGTFALATLARSSGVPFYTLCSSARPNSSRPSRRIGRRSMYGNNVAHMSYS